jgi:excisionase family DNA binding protein
LKLAVSRPRGLLVTAHLLLHFAFFQFFFAVNLDHSWPHLLNLPKTKNRLLISVNLFTSMKVEQESIPAKEPSTKTRFIPMEKTPAPSLDHLLTIRQVAELLKISKSTVRRWADQGRLPMPIRFTKTCIRWKASAIQAHLASLHGTR